MSAALRAPPGPPQAAPTPSVGPREMVAIACRHRWAILAALLVPPAIALALLLLLPNVYRAQSDILVKTGREYLAQSDGESGTTAPTSTKQEGINSEIALLTSRAVAEASIAAIGLERLYPRLVANPPSSGSLLDAAVTQFGKDLGVEPVKLSNVVSVAFDAESPELAKEVLDAVIRLYIAKHTEVFAGSRAEGYQAATDATLEEVRRLEARRSEIKLGHGIYDIVAQRQSLINQRVDAENHLQDARNRQAKLLGRLAYLGRARSGIASVSTSTTTERNEDSVHARQALIDLRQAEAAMAARYGAANPELLRLRSQIASLERDAALAGPQRTNKGTSPSALGQQVDQEIVLGEAELSTMQDEIDRYRALVRDRGAELERLERADLELRTTVLRIEVLTDNLRSLQGRYEQARTQEQTELARQVSVVQVARAIASERPVRPKRLLLGLGGGLGGILLAGAVAVAAIVTNKTVVTADAAERLLGLPVLAVVPVRGRTGPITLELE